MFYCSSNPYHCYNIVLPHHNYRSVKALHDSNHYTLTMVLAHRYNHNHLPSLLQLYHSLNIQRVPLYHSTTTDVQQFSYSSTIIKLQIYHNAIKPSPQYYQTSTTAASHNCSSTTTILSQLCHSITGARLQLNHNAINHAYTTNLSSTTTVSVTLQLYTVLFFTTAHLFSAVLIYFYACLFMMHIHPLPTLYYKPGSSALSCVDLFEGFAALIGGSILRQHIKVADKLNNQFAVH